MTDYQQAKQQLSGYAKQAKIEWKGDNPAIREGINNCLDLIIRHYRWTGTRYESLLSNYACKLHPK